MNRKVPGPQPIWGARLVLSRLSNTGSASADLGLEQRRGRSLGVDNPFALATLSPCSRRAKREPLDWRQSGCRRELRSDRIAEFHDGGLAVGHVE